MRISDWSSDVCSSDLLIDGLGRCRLRVRIAAESHAETLPDALRLAIRNMFGTEKGQVLEQVGEAALLFGFEHRADVHPHPDRHLPRRHAIVAHRIAQPIRQFAELPGRSEEHTSELQSNNTPIECRL